MEILKVNIPVNSTLKITDQKFDYQDCFEGELIDVKNLVTPRDACIAFLTCVRIKIQKLLDIKNRLMPVFARKAPKENIKMPGLSDFKYKAGEQLGLLKVFYRSNNEIILGANLKRFDFRISLFLSEAKESGERKLSFTTAVVYNGTLGRFLFLLIKPLHKLFARQLLQSTIKEIERLVAQNKYESIIYPTAFKNESS